MYRYKATDINTWSSYTNITVNVNNDGNISSNDLIQSDIADSFDIGNSYNIEVLISDELSSIIFTANLGSGISNIALHKNLVGIMGKYNTNEDVYYKFQVRIYFNILLMKLILVINGLTEKLYMKKYLLEICKILLNNG